MINHWIRIENRAIDSNICKYLEPNKGSISCPWEGMHYLIPMLKHQSLGKVRLFQQLFLTARQVSNIQMRKTKRKNTLQNVNHFYNLSINEFF